MAVTASRRVLSGEFAETAQGLSSGFSRGPSGLHAPDLAARRMDPDAEAREPPGSDHDVAGRNR